MKRIYLSLIVLLFAVSSSYAQWTNESGTGNYYLNSGNVGIGTTSPTGGILQIAAPDQATSSSIAIRQSGNSQYGFDFALDGTVNGVGYFYGIFNGNRTSLMKFDRTNNYVLFPGGNVGIGTASPTAGILQVNAPDQAISSAIAIRQGSNSLYGFDFALDETTNGMGYFYGIYNGNRTSLMQFDRTNNYVLYPGGNVGIGTVNPHGKLDVNGALLVPGSSSNTMSRPSIGNLRIIGEISGYSAGSLAADDGFLRLSAGGGTNAGIKSFIDLSGYSTVPDMKENIIFGTAGAECMRITSTGNVGIGTATPQAALDIRNGAIHVLGGFSADYSNQGAYTGWNGSGGGGETNFTNNIGGGVAGGFTFDNVSLSNISTRLMTILGNGNVGIGTTSTGYKLQVQTTGGGPQISVLSPVTSNAGIDYQTTLGHWTMGVGLGRAADVFDLRNETTGTEVLTVNNTGNVAIGTTTFPTGYKLAVAGSAIAESMTVKLQANWPDYVFKPTYHLPTLAEVKAYIDRNQHLPDMPSEQEVTNKGLNLGEIVKLQTKKIEELTLYLIEKDKQVSDLTDKLRAEDDRLKKLEQQMEALHK